ncbi:S1 family peptidase [Actinoplanes sp. GCM10030250]|uniref:S1 family peptidase n=1 Tax=Actinoplanes sp. GCM10030250 TaxID=3273376 RepID=UPI0036064596
MGVAAVFYAARPVGAKWKIVTAAAALSVGAVLAGVPAHAIANGDRVPDGRYPFAVKITELGIPTADGGTRDSSCSGGLISPRWIITAAHCFRDEDGNRVSRTVAEKTTATVGRADLTGKAGVTAKVVEVRQHGRADVALARLDRAITGITPLRLNRRKPAAGLPARLVGYGFTSKGASRTPDRLRTGRFEVTSVSKTEMGLSGVAPKQNTSPCERDSGGPYFTEVKGAAVVVGVVSRGPDCPHTGPDIATRVDAIAPWILSVIKSDLAKAQPAVKPGSGPRSPAVPSKGSDPPPAAAPASERPPLTWLAIPIVLAGAIGLIAIRGGRRRGIHRRR